VSAVQKLPRQELLLRARAKQELDRRHVDRACAQRIISHKAGPMLWLRHWTATENFQWQEQGLQPKMPFPYKPYDLKREHWQQVIAALPFEHDLTPDDPPDYVDIVAGYWMCTKELFIPKTREMMTSWLICGLITWHCQFHASVEWLSQSEDDLKAQGLIKYANILYANQPEWLKARHPLKRGEEGTAHKIEWANGSTYLGLPSGVRKLASRHPHGYFSDESAHQPAWEETLNVAKPAVRQVVCVSSVAPGSFWNEVQAAV
jgi:hypothetical protein